MAFEAVEGGEKRGPRVKLRGKMGAAGRRGGKPVKGTSLHGLVGRRSSCVVSCHIPLRGLVLLIPFRSLLPLVFFRSTLAFLILLHQSHNSGSACFRVWQHGRLAQQNACASWAPISKRVLLNVCLPDVDPLLHRWRHDMNCRWHLHPWLSNQDNGFSSRSGTWRAR